jgi:hypothetical protein
MGVHSGSEVAMPASVLQIIGGSHLSGEARARLLRAFRESQKLMRSNLALQAEVSESHSEFDEALWRLRQATAMSR